MAILRGFPPSNTISPGIYPSGPPVPQMYVDLISEFAPEEKTRNFWLDQDKDWAWKNDAEEAE